MQVYGADQEEDETGDRFEACERQTAFPIWKCSKLQEELQLHPGERLSEQGGPLVCFFANRGEDWRLYACFLDIEENGKGRDNEAGGFTTSYCLWSGRVDTHDGALQILLLVDYIFDWARDIYRSGILQDPNGVSLPVWTYHVSKNNTGSSTNSILQRGSTSSATITTK
ncbi:hypothetical protein DL98DRAFT_637260 [Cadophora sp. DSE1049]|nr:hypothetical protein DL98DRAFT_637260 [Cadophora sp. DSE1049]